MSKKEIAKAVEKLAGKIEFYYNVSDETCDGETRKITKCAVDEWIDELNLIKNRIEEL